ncbi:MAG: hypothetical protein ISQ34_04645, partial [Rickettsiales bacterium]|nr:hypothetical protein [Rickettsiales bacterium]
RLEVISKRGIIFDDECSQAVVPCLEGEVGFMVGHEIFVSILREGKLRVLGNNDELIKEIDIKGGYAEMRENNELVVLVD